MAAMCSPEPDEVGIMSFSLHLWRDICSAHGADADSTSHHAFLCRTAYGHPSSFLLSDPQLDMYLEHTLSPISISHATLELVTGNVGLQRLFWICMAMPTSRHPLSLGGSLFFRRWRRHSSTEAMDEERQGMLRGQGLSRIYRPPQCIDYRARSMMRLANSASANTTCIFLLYHASLGPTQNSQPVPYKLPL
jgi:hypothetical protein